MVKPCPIAVWFIFEWHLNKGHKASNLDIGIEREVKFVRQISYLPLSLPMFQVLNDSLRAVLGAVQGPIFSDGL